MCSFVGELVNYDLMLKSITNNMYEFMKCSGCKEFCHPPFKQTLLGKLICITGLRSHSECKLCDRVISTARLFEVERMYLLLVFSCKYYHQGCTFFWSSVANTIIKDVNSGTQGLNLKNTVSSVNSFRQSALMIVVSGKEHRQTSLIITPFSMHHS
ncbi:hypothetical protein WA026_008966 [Henosepilachna vigintioctopunctata]|uniref:Uncharacterized protein n=1 Tax=Henosepilachna vigintioctopunctata TaxID=420089 RepID=A0AAW1V998_9CUCU